MYKKFSVLFLMLMLSVSLVTAQDPGPPSTLQPGESYTGLWSISYDYQTNGSVRYLVQDPANSKNWCSILMGQPDSTTAVGVGRRVYYAYSDDNGATWTRDILDDASNQGFPCITLSNGVPVIARHVSATVGTLVSKDAFFGAFGFANIPGVPTNLTGNLPIWPHIAGTANGNLVLVAAPNNTDAFFANRTTWNNGSNTWSPYVQMSEISGPSGNFDVGSNSNGKVCIVGVNYIPEATATFALRLYSSIDNGNTFDNGTDIFTNLIVGSDTLFANLAGGYSIVYVGDEPHVIFAAYNAYATATPNLNAYQTPSLYHWSVSTGLDLIASRTNIPTLADTIFQVNMVPITQPTITILPSGKLLCAYTVFLDGNVQTVQNGDVLNAGEIFTSVSSDNGNTWSTPKNETNTPFVEEKHPSLAPKTSSDSLRLYYVRDKLAGAWVQQTAWGLGPVYGIFKKAAITVGIRENVSIAKDYELFQNYPNPFNPTTTISYYVQKTGLVTLKVYNALGREVASLVNDIQTQGPKEITFAGNKLASGIYYYSITAGDFRDTKKMMLIK